MRTLKVVPTINKFDTCIDFCKEFNVGKGDLIITSKHTYDDFLKDATQGAFVIFLRDFGNGEPTDAMVEAIHDHLKDIDYKRVIGIGGGAIIDVAKWFVLETIKPVTYLYDKKVEPKKTKELILIPTTCGTGSEVTNISVLEIVSRRSKFGLAIDEFFADSAILIPELLSNLPFRFFATSSIDAFIHAIESYLSPKASRMTKMYSKEAMEIIIESYKIIAEKGEASRIEMLEDFLYASIYAGIAFGNAGTGGVHAMSLPFGAAYHVPHGEANYAFFSAVFKVYQKGKPEGNIKELNEFLANLLSCHWDEVYDALDVLFSKLIKRKSLKEYGTKIEQLEEFTENVMTKQGRLMVNTYFPLDRDIVYNIYEEIY
jgi:4-hydroxybutyrate dehydrogenase